MAEPVITVKMSPTQFREIAMLIEVAHDFADAVLKGDAEARRIGARCGIESASDADHVGMTARRINRTFGFGLDVERI